YKIKRGKQESYVKDDSELNQLLLNSALENADLHVNGEAPPLSGSALELLARKYVEVQAIMKRWSQRYDERLLEQLIYMPEVTLLERSEEHTSELQSPYDLVCRLLLEKKKIVSIKHHTAIRDSSH